MQANDLTMQIVAAFANSAEEMIKQGRGKRRGRTLVFLSHRVALLRRRLLFRVLMVAGQKENILLTSHTP
jgi:hypothetical protein